MKKRKLFSVVFTIVIIGCLLPFNSLAQVCFDAATYASVGSDPQVVVSSDFNNDGEIDIAIANSGTSNISVFIGTGTGSFGTGTNYSVGSWPHSIICADFNGDGKIDIATANADGTVSNVSILLGDNSGNFSTATNFAVSGYAQMLCSDDFNGDGKIDLAVANESNNAASILLGDGNGNFGAQTDVSTGPSPKTIINGDFNADGKADLLVGSHNSGWGKILLADGNGSFITSNFNAGIGAFSQTGYVIGDFNGDSKMDVAIIDRLKTYISILPGNGSGSFGSATTVPIPSNPHSIIGSDFNGDGKMDLATSNINTNNISVLLANGQGSFGTAINFSVANGPNSITSADFNGDGLADIISAHPSSDSISVLLSLLPPPVVANATATTITEGSSVTLTGSGASTYAWTNGVIDGVPVYPTSTTTYILTGFVSGCSDTASKMVVVIPRPFPIITSISPTNGPVGTTVTIKGSNFNTTATSNIVFFGATKATVSVASDSLLTVTVPYGATCKSISVTDITTGLTGQSNKSFFPTFFCGGTISTGSFIHKGYYARENTPVSINTADIDGDGKADATVTARGGITSVFRNISTSDSIIFAAKTDFSYGSDCVLLGDLDGDGKPDMVVTNKSSNSVSVFRNTSTIGTISFATPISLPTGVEPWYVIMGDLDNDGKFELITVNTQYNPGNISVLKNTSSIGNLSFAAVVNFACGSYPQSITIGDVDGDNKPELVVSNAVMDKFTILRNTTTLGIISFAAYLQFSTGGYPQYVLLEDMDNDGKKDITIAETNSVCILSTYRNTSSIGSISFASKVNFGTGAGSAPASSFTVSDLDGDAKPDIAVAINSAPPSKMSIYKNISTTGSIAYQAQKDFNANGNLGYGISASDLNNDGRPDVLMTNANSDNFSVFKNNIYIAPVMTSTNAITLCSGTAANLTFTSDIASTYSWLASDNSSTSGESLTSRIGNTLNDTIVNNTSTVKTVTYTVTPISITGNCIGTLQTVTVTINPKPAMSNTNADTICSGGTASIILNSSVPSSYAWFATNNSNTTGESTSTQTTNTLSNTITNTTSTAQTVIYSVVPTSTTGNCIGDTQTVNIRVNPLPSMNSIVSSTICSGSAVNIPLSATVASNFTWQATDNANTTGESTSLQITDTLNNTIANTTTTGQTVNYTVIPTSTGGNCTGVSQTVAVTVNPTPVMTSTDTITICSGSTVNLSFVANVASGFSWLATDNTNITGESTSIQSTNTLNNTLINTSTTTQIVNYTVTPTSTTGSCTGQQQTVTVKVNPKPAMNSATADTICSGSNVSIALASNVSSNYTWVANDNTAISGESITAQPTSTLSNTLTNSSTSSQTVTYAVTPTSIIGGCTGNSQTVIATVNPAPVMSSSNAATICSGDTTSISLTASVAANFTWVAGNNINTSGESTTLQTTGTLSNTIINNSTSAQTVSYTVTPTSALGGCTGTSQTVNVTVNPAPVMSSASSATICSGSAVNIQLTSSIGSTYSWIADDNTNTTGESLTSQTTGTLNNIISHSSTSSQVITYSVTPTSIVGSCSGTPQTISVTVNPVPVVNSTSAVTICSNDSATIQLGATVASSFIWQAIDNSNTTGESTSLQTNPTLSNKITNNTTLSQNVTYSVIPLSSMNCTGNTQTVTVTVNPAPTMNSLSSATICSGAIVNIPFTSSLSSSYTWMANENANTSGESTTQQTADTLNNTLINNTTSPQLVNYSIIPTSISEGCSGAAQSVIITVNAKPIITNDSAVTVCSGTGLNLLLNSTIAASYTWVAADNISTSGESISSQSTAAINDLLTNNTSNAQLVNYTVIPTSTIGSCIGASQIVVATVNPKPVMNSTNSDTICSGENLNILLSSSISSNYSWLATDNTNTTGETITLQTSATLNNTIINNSLIPQNINYTVTPVSISGNCIGNAQTVSIICNPTPVINSAATATICSGENIAIPLTCNINAGYTWIANDNMNVNGESTIAQTTDTLDNVLINNTNAAESVNYTITPTSLNGNCAGSTQTVTILVNPVPASNAGNDLTICSGITDSVGTIPVNGYAYLWQPGIGLNDSTISNPVNTTINTTEIPIVTVYTLTTSIPASGCNSIDSVIITVNPQPALSITDPSSACFPDSVDITATLITAGSTGGGTFSYWNDDSATDSLLTPAAIVANDTNYIKVTAIGGCTDIKPVIALVNPLPSVSFSGLNSINCYNASAQLLTGTPAGGIFNGYGIVGDTYTAALSGQGIIDTITYTYADTNGCTNTTTQYTEVLQLPSAPEICLVTVDTFSNYNIILWDKTSYTNVDSFIVYRETTNNVYNRIGSLHYDSLSLFIDTVRQLYFPNTGNPNIGTYKYKLQTRDTCGNYSDLSPYHKTIYVNQTGGTFSFNDYEIEGETMPVPQLSDYLLLRDANSNGAWQVLSSNTSSPMSDPGFNSFPNAQWRVETNWNISCTPTRTATPTRSNIKRSIVNSVTSVNEEWLGISIYPNPFSNSTTITYNLSQPSNVLIEVFNNLGQKTETIADKNQSAGIHTLSFTANENKSDCGIYTVKFNIEGKVFTRRIVKIE